MRVPLQTILDPNFLAAFNKLCQQSLSLPDNLRLARAARVINRETETFNTARLAFFKANGTANAGNWTLDPEKPGLLDRYNTEMAQVLAMEVELPLLAPVKLPADCTLTALELLPLLDLVEE